MKLGFGTLPGSGGPELRLPAKALLAGWILTSILMFLGCWLLTPWLLGLLSAQGVDSAAKSGPAVLGAAIASVMMGLGLLVVTPWRPRPATEMPLVWLASTVIRFLATPAVAFLLYFAIHPPTRPFVLGLALCYLALLFVEVLITVFDLRRQLDRIETEQAREEG